MDRTSKFRVENNKPQGIKLTKIGSFSFEEMELPETVYKYRIWTNDLHKTVLTKRILYLAAPSSFDDPIDCKNPVRWDLLRKKDIYFKYFNEIKKLRPYWPKYLMKSWAKMWYKKSPLRDKSYVKQCQEQTQKDFDCRFGVLSLTANPTNPDMWITYSDNFRGFCVGFHPAILFKNLGGGCEVQYVYELPKIFPIPRYSYEQQHFLQVFFKEKKWEYEQEYRTHKFSPIPMTIDDRKIVIPPEAYKEIILGMNMPESIKKDLITSLPMELKHIKIINQS